MRTDMIADYVYHFMPLRRRGLEREDFEHVEAAVLHSEYFFGNPLEFNDPFDCKPNFRPGIRDGVDCGNLRKRLHDTLDHVGIFCVAEELYNTLMWSHYTNGHRGVALQFSTQQIRTAFDGIGIVDKVRYQKTLPTIGWCRGDKIQQMRRIVFRKSRQWTYEKEVRIVLPEVTNRVQALPQMPVRNVYLGCRIEKDDASRLIAAFKRKTNRVYRLRMSSKRFAYRRRAARV